MELWVDEPRAFQGIARYLFRSMYYQIREHSFYNGTFMLEARRHAVS
jgi:hypothetical protein